MGVGWSTPIAVPSRYMQEREMKKKYITLEYRPSALRPLNDALYQVKEVRNSTQFAPRTWLNQNEVNDLCHAPSWEVKVIGDRDVV